MPIRCGRSAWSTASTKRGGGSKAARSRENRHRANEQKKLAGKLGEKRVEMCWCWWESSDMAATTLREKNQTTIPMDVVDAAGIKVKDRIEWSFEDGKIVGRKLVRQVSHELDVDDLDPVTLLPKKGKIVPGTLEASIRADRDRR
jgi:hypothetical protein